MSMYTTFKTYSDVLDYLQAAEYPKCFTVNYKPDTDEYALWIGNQPYYVYEKWIEEEEQKVKELEEIVSQLRWTMLSKILQLKRSNEIINEIVSPEIEKWNNYKSINGKEISFQEYVKHIAEDYLNKYQEYKSKP